MNNFKKSALTALVAGAIGFSGSLLAADEKSKADASVAQDPKLENLDKSHPATGDAASGEQQAATPAKQPDLETAGSAHPATKKGEDKGQAGPAGKDAAAPAAEPTTTAADSTSAGTTGNSHWGQIDSDSDNLVTPDEMEKFLQAKNSAGTAEPKATGAAGPTGESGTLAPANKESMEKDAQPKGTSSK